MSSLSFRRCFFKPFEHLIGGRLFFRFDAIDLPIDLIVVGRKLSKLIIAFYQALDE